VFRSVGRLLLGAPVSPVFAQGFFAEMDNLICVVVDNGLEVVVSVAIYVKRALNPFLQPH